MPALVQTAVKTLASLVYHVPMDHNTREIHWWIKYKIKNLFKYRTFDFFYKVELETITNCNRRCSYCPNSKTPKTPRLMEETIFKKAVADLADINYSGILAPHFYGEPLLDSRLPNLLSYAKQKLPNTSILLYTNGDYLSRELFLKLKDSGVNDFFVTEHENKPPKKFMEWHASASASDKKHIIFQKMNENSILSNRGGAAVVAHKKPFSKCSIPRNNLVINADGNVLLCCNDFFGKYVFGNIKEKPLIDIWHSEPYAKARNEINKGEFNLEICKKCRS
ncbi:MAG: radical SAM/SPASM domain-containing protein [Candidatus Micrarchaeota archaeon]